jgi:hypothetical protein
MKEVYVLHHSHDLESEETDIKLIGVYSTKEKAKRAISKLSVQPGFKDTREGFNIDRYEIDKEHWEEGFITV